MKTDRQIYSFRNDECKFTIAEHTLEEFDSLPAEQRWILVTSGVKQWRNHTAPRQTKDAGFVNNGKTFDLAGIAEDLAREGRENGPTKAAREAGEDLAARARKACPSVDSPDVEGEAPEATLERVKAEKAALAESRRVWCMVKFEAIQTLKPWINFTWDNAASLESNCIALQHAAAQKKPEPKKAKVPTFV